ncbi:DUF523 domain-containing protein [Pseudoalteromonas sp. MTN2-4]|uniref:DUF523 domain-containing protein n=1 Tax=Pseudoalteromonas sp. MTN2-4 TaxID=3056555 RepID=UPI0036F1D0F0
MHKILVSSCLLGQPVRYDGQSKGLTNDILTRWLQEKRVVAFCPEVTGGLPTPRAPAEINAERVIMTTGEDVTSEFQLGAQKALALCDAQQIKFALLKESSPSCGRNTIYDGSHNGVKVAGMGLTAKKLVKAGIQVFSEEQLPQLVSALAIAEKN